mmetsp:Transcript_96467/g.191094  ORF Transcript_96467/g.191094 Transcript_96467/m.191094 type:complete len:298 (+) Transcript_96467:65-958(+)
MAAASLLGLLQSLLGQGVIAFAFAIFWTAFIEAVRIPIGDRVRKSEWWPRAVPPQINIMVNFGYSKDKTTEDHALYGFVWIITMCITHIVSASLMVPVMVYGWSEAGDVGQVLFFLGTLSEVGFDVYDWSKTFLLTFAHSSVSNLGPPGPVKAFVLICILHHSTVLGLTFPMNLKYPSMTAYHWVAFSLLVSAGVCYIAGQYKFTLDAKTKSGLATIKLIMTIQFVFNWLSRVGIWFPAVFIALRTMYGKGDMLYFTGGLIGGLGMSLYNLLVVADATMALLKWLPRTVDSCATKES